MILLTVMEKRKMGSPNAWININQALGVHCYKYLISSEGL